jgi:hypothetical protein
MLDHSGDRRALRYIGGDSDRAAPSALDVSHDRVCVSGTLAIVDRNRGAALGKRQGDRGSDATGPAGHQCNAAFQVGHACHDLIPSSSR